MESMTSASDLMKKPIGIMNDATVSDILRKMLDNNISRLLIRDGQTPIGIVTEKDIGFFLFQENTIQSLDRISPDKIIKKITYVGASESIQNCAKMMIDKNHSSLAVGKEPNVDGIFTKTDLVRHYTENFTGKNKVVDFMTKDYLSTHASAPLSHVIEKMLEHKVSRLIIKNQQNEPSGIISFRDFFKISLNLGSEDDILEDSVPSGNKRRGFLSAEGFGGISQAKDIMTRGLLSVKFNEDLTYAGKMILEENVSGLAVLDGNNILAGIISKTDITRALASA